MPDNRRPVAYNLASAVTRRQGMVLVSTPGAFLGRESIHVTTLAVSAGPWYRGPALGSFSGLWADSSGATKANCPHDGRQDLPYGRRGSFANRHGPHQDGQSTPLPTDRAWHTARRTGPAGSRCHFAKPGIPRTAVGYLGTARLNPPQPQGAQLSARDAGDRVPRRRHTIAHVDPAGGRTPDHAGNLRDAFPGPV